MVATEARKGGRWFFLLMLLLVSAGIAATVLLANEKRNLRLLLQALGLEVRTMVIPKPGKTEPLKNKSFKGKRLTEKAIMLPDNILAEPVKNRESAFMRSFLKDPAKLCTKLKIAGFDVSPFQPGSFSKTVFECWNEQTVPNAARPDAPSTFFLMVKGTPEGQLFSARVKFVLSDPKLQPQLAGQAASMLSILSEQTGWGEIGDAELDVRALKPFALNEFGVSAKFSKEFTSDGGYNLIVAAGPRRPPQRRTEDFFDRKNFFPLLPDHGGPPLPEVTG